jgi:predicted flap endonuclease-1-like 5' DNA nuclease
MIMEKINLKYTEVLTEIENKSIDEIINIKGIGPKTIQHLKNGGITTIKKLEEIDIKDLMLIKRIRKKTARLLKESYNKIIFD